MTTEQEWIEAARQGDERAFAELVRTYESKVYHLALRMCGNREDALEIAQEAFLSAWRGLPFFREESSFATWLYRLTTNAAIDFLRREKRRVAVLETEAFILSVACVVLLCLLAIFSGV